MLKYLRTFLASIWLLFVHGKPSEMKITAAKAIPKPYKPFLPLDLQLFADPPAPPAPPAPPTPPEPPKDKTFSQSDVDKLVQDGVAKATKEAQEILAKQLGFDSVEAMTKDINKNKPPAKPPTEPINVDAVVEAKLKEERDKTFKRLVNSEVKLLATELGFADWEDALALSDLTQVKEDEKGNIVGVKEALEALFKKKPHLLKTQQGGRFGAEIPSNNQQQKKETLESIKKLAANRGAQQSTTTYNPWA
jgi:hypothetical protein